MFLKSRFISVKAKQTSQNLCLSDHKKGSIQHRKHFKIKLVKNKKTQFISSGPFIPENIEKISRRRKDSNFDSTFLEGPSVDKLIEKANYFEYTSGEIRIYIKEGKSNDKKRSLII
jgi:hypothetical protein